MMKQKRIAVLPFKNQSNESWDYLAQGLTELALDCLRQYPDLLVIARESIEQLSQNEKDHTEAIFERLNIDILLIADLKIEKTLQLKISAKGKDQTIWTKQLEAEMKQVISFGNELINFLNTHFEKSKIPFQNYNSNLPKNRQAYRAYLLGNHYLNKWNRAYTELALVQFEKVAELEPDFIPAYLGIAKATVFLVSRGFKEADQHYPKVTQMLNRMLLLNPSYGELYIYKGIIEFFYVLDWDSAYRNIEQGLKNYSEASEAYTQLSLFWYGMREYDKAIEAIHLAMEYNPLSTSLLNMKGDVLLSAKRYEEAIKIFNSILELQPKDKVTLENLMYLHALKNDERNAKKYFRLLTKDNGVSTLSYPRLGFIYAKFGMERELQLAMEQLEENKISGSGRLAMIYAGQNNWNKVMENIETYFNNRMGIIYVLTDPIFEKLRTRKSYRKLEAQIKLPQGILEGEKITIQSELKTKIDINPQQLLYAKSDENYTTLVLYNNFRLEETLLRISLKNLISQLPKEDFFHCHRSYLVNNNLSFEKKGNSRGYILRSLEYGFTIPVSRSKIEEMKSQLS